MTRWCWSQLQAAAARPVRPVRTSPRVCVSCSSRSRREADSTASFSSLSSGTSGGGGGAVAAAGIAGFRSILSHVAAKTPLRRTVTTEDVGNAAAFLCSDLAAGITGEITYVDAGYNILGMADLAREDA